MKKQPTIIVYQKSTCTKCRDLLKTLKEKDVSFEAVDYYKQPFTREGLKELLGKLGMRPGALLRTKEPIYKELAIGTTAYSDEELIALMVLHPELIQRPIVVSGDTAVLARPKEAAERLR
jgi:arsenate reductase